MSDTIVYRYDHRLRRPVAIKNIKEESVLVCDQLLPGLVSDNNETKENVATKKEATISDDAKQKNIIKRLAFFCFYGQIRSPEHAIANIKEIRQRLEMENYDVKIFAHVWHDYDELEYDTSHNLGLHSNNKNLHLLLSEYKPTRISIENPTIFTTAKKCFDKVNLRGKGSNILSQMNSRMKVRNLVYEYCKENNIDESYPVFMMRLDFRNRIKHDVLNDFNKSPNSLILSAGYKFNDNCMLMSLPNFLRFFDKFDMCVEKYLNDDNIQAKEYGWWCPESFLSERRLELKLDLTYSDKIPNFM